MRYWPFLKVILGQNAFRKMLILKIPVLGYVIGFAAFPLVLKQLYIKSDQFLPSTQLKN